VRSVGEIFASSLREVKYYSKGLTYKHKIVFCYTLRLLEEFGLSSKYTVAFSNKKYTCGMCYAPQGRGKGCIELSKEFINYNSYERILEVILHEIAHALVGNRHNHDKVWKAKARQLGISDNIKVDSNIPPAVYVASCCVCKEKYGRYRRPQKRKTPSCKKCGTRLCFIKV
jgi:predicted SprT family Zn-dependent metalloprotease